MTNWTTDVTSSRHKLLSFARVAAALALALAACLALTAAPAGAATTRILESTFTGADTPGGAFSFGPFGGAAVDNSGGPSAGDVYVGETSYFTMQSRVVKFDASGTYAGLEFKGEDTPGER